MARLIPSLAASLSCLALLAGCAADEIGDDASNFSSDQATLLEFEFDGELVGSWVANAERAVEDQLLYTIGHLNGEHALGRLDKLEVTDVEREQIAGGKTRVRYHAKMPVAWGRKSNLPESYTFKLPVHVDYDDYRHFTDTYKHDCVEYGAHDVDSGSMWYYYRPNRSGCHLADADIFTTTASVTVSEENTTGRYPEYHKVWDDDALTVVAIFGKYEDGATSSDAGISGYNTFVREITRKLSSHELSTEPAEVPTSPGVAVPDITFRATLADGRRVEVVALLVDNVRTAGPTFDARYEALSGDADMIFYNGHAGLGANIRALASKGKFKAGKYQIFFMNGCDTFAYVDDQLQQAHADVNDDDPVGSLYLDTVTNVMPSFFSSMPHASLALVDGLLGYAQPKTYQQIFKNIDKSEVVVVTGEEDNVYHPGYEPGGGSGWQGIDEQGALGRGESKNYELAELGAGSYVFTTSHDPAQPGGDVDLYLAIGRQPTLDDYDERPYLNGSDETISIELAEPARVYLMVYGYDYADNDSSAYLLAGHVASD